LHDAHAALHAGVQVENARQRELQHAVALQRAHLKYV
jgi:hypothetical protein